MGSERWPWQVFPQSTDSKLAAEECDMVLTEEWKDESCKGAETLTTFTPRLSLSGTSLEAFSGPYGGSRWRRTNSRVRQLALSQRVGQGEQNTAKPLVAASLSLCNHPHQQTPPLQPAGPAAAPATRPRRKAMNSKTCRSSSRWSDLLI